MYRQSSFYYGACVSFPMPRLPLYFTMHQLVVSAPCSLPHCFCAVFNIMQPLDPKMYSSKAKAKLYLMRDYDAMPFIVFF